MNQEVKQKWVEALRSRKYKQGQAQLREGDRYCCLGVLCDIHAKETGHQWEDGGASYVYFDIEGVLPDEVQAWAGLDDADPEVVWPKHNLGALCLSDINDKGTPFKAIATLIEKYL